MNYLFAVLLIVFAVLLILNSPGLLERGGNNRPSRNLWLALALAFLALLAALSPAFRKKYNQLWQKFNQY